MTKLRVCLVSNVFKFEYNKSVIPAVVVFKYKNITFCFDYNKYRYRSKVVHNTRYAIHTFTAEIKSVRVLKGKEKLIPNDLFLDAFKGYKIKVLGIILLDEHNQYKPLISEDFQLNDDKGFGVTLIIDEKEYSNIKLDKNFKIQTR